MLTGCEMERTICRHAGRGVVRFTDEGDGVKPEILACLDRLSDVIWALGCRIERNAGVDATLRSETRSDLRWSRAW